MADETTRSPLHLATNLTAEAVGRPEEGQNFDNRLGTQVADEKDAKGVECELVEGELRFPERRPLRGRQEPRHQRSQS